MLLFFTLKIKFRNQISFNTENCSYHLILKKINKKVKLVLSKCCVCDGLLESDHYIQTGPKVFCQKCYFQSFKCQRCDEEIRDVEYFTINQVIYCKSCFHKTKSAQFDSN